MPHRRTHLLDWDRRTTRHDFIQVRLQAVESRIEGWVWLPEVVGLRVAAVLVLVEAPGIRWQVLEIDAGSRRQEIAGDHLQAKQLPAVIDREMPQALEAAESPERQSYIDAHAGDPAESGTAPFLSRRGLIGMRSGRGLHAKALPTDDPRVQQALDYLRHTPQGVSTAQLGDRFHWDRITTERILYTLKRSGQIVTWGHARGARWGVAAALVGQKDACLA